ncbi:MAG: anti-sigma factor antagonist [Terriglobia bacterium]|nr:MAG: anti-sigma factor antagonist [Terriglobia bacterium]
MQSHAATRQAGNVAIVDLSGGITIAGGIGLLRNTIQQLVAAGHKNVLLNLQGLLYIDSAGMGELVGACTTVRNLGGDVKLVNPQARVTHLLQMTKLASMFKVFTDEKTALASFGE